MGGYVQTGANGLCELCQYKSGDEYAASFNVYYSHRWLDWGLQFLYIGFNFTVVFFATWLYLKGGKKIKARLGFLSPKKLGKIKHLKKSKEASSEG